MSVKYCELAQNCIEQKIPHFTFQLHFILISLTPIMTFCCIIVLQYIIAGSYHHGIMRLVLYITLWGTMWLSPLICTQTSWACSAQFVWCYTYIAWTEIKLKIRTFLINFVLCTRFQIRLGCTISCSGKHFYLHWQFVVILLSGKLTANTFPSIFHLVFLHPSQKSLATP